MEQIPLTIARTQLSALVQKAPKRPRISLHGKPVAAIVPHREALVLEALDDAGTLQNVLDALP